MIWLILKLGTQYFNIYRVSPPFFLNSWRSTLKNTPFFGIHGPCLQPKKHPLSPCKCGLACAPLLDWTAVTGLCSNLNYTGQISCFTSRKMGHIHKKRMYGTMKKFRVISWLSWLRGCIDYWARNFMQTLTNAGCILLGFSKPNRCLLKASDLH